MWVPAGVFNCTLESRGGIIYASISPQISASAPRSHRPPLKWERCSTRPPPGTAAYTWDREPVFYCEVCELLCSVVYPGVGAFVPYLKSYLKIAYQAILYHIIRHLIISYL